MKRPLLWTLVVLLAVAAAPRAAHSADEILLSLADPPASGLVVVPVDLTAAARLAGMAAIPADALRARDSAGRPIPFQFVPGADFDTKAKLSGTAVLQLPAGATGPLRLTVSEARPAAAPGFDGVVVTRFAKIAHERRQGGFPVRIELAAGGKVIERLSWNDRLHHRELHGFCLRHDAAAGVECVSRGPLATVVRQRAAYCRPDGTRPASQPGATYDWYYFHDRPVVFVSGVLAQREPFTWHEAHFLEMTFSEKVFGRFAGGDPAVEGAISDSRKVDHLSRWGAALDGQNAIGMFGGGPVYVYHGPPGAKYLHARGPESWRDWKDTRRELSAWLWIGAAQDPKAAIAAAARELAGRARAVVSTSGVRALVQAARQSGWAQAAAAGLLESQGRLDEARQAAQGALPAGWLTLRARELGAIFSAGKQGLELVSLYDTAKHQELLARQGVPLFEIVVRNGQTTEELRVAADSGWRQVTPKTTGVGAEFRLAQPVRSELAGLAVDVRVTADAGRSRLGWRIEASAPPAPWALWTVAFPRVALEEGGPESRVFYPQAAGVVKPTAAGQAGSYHGTYPSGWTCMQFQALYDPGRETGLYLGIHDPLASTKEVLMESRAGDRAVVLAFEHPVPNMGRPGVAFELPCESVWQLLRGDWYDAAVIYRDWVRGAARWYPQLGPDGRGDTPMWMRELPAWLQTGGSFEQIVPLIEEFRAKLGLPVGLHWYNWHQIPFDNDYPHYFPTKPGFKDLVARLQGQGVFVMPYINGRLWDTRDRGLEDFEFSRVARPAATKDDQQKPRTEMYGSKEKDGSQVVLAAMCPTTRLWQDKLREIDLTLFNEYGVKAIYMDQVAAAKANLCFDPAHGHPLGGGHWWCEQGYWPLLEAIRRAMPKDRVLTTECNAEPYARWFDGYLTWHWQYDGQVPAFSAVYGGAIQMFGRAYRGGPTRDLALRMKAGQQLVFGEQIGWLGPDAVRRAENFAFLRQAIHLRWNLRRYFYAGEMARPPRLVGAVPRVTADWQWHNEWPVTTDQVLCGAWRLPREGRMVLLFVNVGDTPVTARVDYDLRAYGFAKPAVRATRLTAEGRSESLDLTPKIDRSVTFAPGIAWAWEVK